ncbi:hypothetical protein BCV69DRAFT_277921 [Microstroma glucosiphilum]|uniref:Uncharacterized protein n=1 Tax=Pseudomicrostroma glucosiphilum TaxID=1684307 RepID=A0A316U4I9_9BASI|nr:hypothetical protein BCV69DRAFT_277921 [Pseudomicrostroma glucosiphilum]PWN20172.1 hypothetical protein BCV69DRAFT_277921 [Pseudomicrostroma glucosiphilum]
MRNFSIAMLCLTFASLALANFCGLKFKGEWKTCSHTLDRLTSFCVFYDPLYLLTRGGCTTDIFGYSQCFGPRGETGDIGTPCAVLKSRDSEQPVKQCDKGKGCGYLGNIKDMGCH